MKAGKVRKFVTVKDNSAFDSEEIKDNVMYIQGILLLSECKEMYKICKNTIFLQKNIHYSYQSICEIKIISLFLQATIPEKYEY